MTIDETKPRSAKRQKQRSNTLVVDLKDLKRPWTAWCERQSLTPSEAVRRTLSEILAAEIEGGAASAKPQLARSTTSTKRLELRVSPEEYALIASTAASEGMSVPRWIHALMAVHLAKRVQFGVAETEALARSSQALLAIGRGLNQQIRERTAAGNGGDVTLAQIVFLADLVKTHTKEVSRLLDANAQRWAP
ncbi:MAG TPA: hypothetical protein VN112_05680 [Ensifer sp.]|nr:hypothetical protein [Ensifer sp.]